MYMTTDVMCELAKFAEPTCMHITNVYLNMLYPVLCRGQKGTFPSFYFFKAERPEEPQG